MRIETPISYNKSESGFEMEFYYLMDANHETSKGINDSSTERHA
jgi:hypothetical protein